MASPEITRLNYYQRQFLNAQDFLDEQAYHRGMRRRHNIGQHTWGIVEGLELLEKPREGDPPFVDVWIQPGMAIDGFGREIFVLQPIKLDSTLLDAFANLLHREVWIAFDEEKGDQKGTGLERCDPSNGFSRLRENALPVIEPLAPTHDPIIVAGVEVQFPAVPAQGDLVIPEDLSVPQQQITNPDTRKWLIRLGSVNWDGSLGVKKFRPAAADRLMEGREYVSVIASQVMSPSDTLRLAPRVTPKDADAADFASVDGRLQVNGRIVAKADVFLHGGKLSFQSAAGLDEGAPLWMQRLPAVAQHELRIHIGDSDSEPKNRLTVGPLSGAGKEKPVLMVSADDHVSIPSGTLDFDAATRQMIDLWKSEYGIGVQSGALYFRTSSDVYWWKGGAHKDDPTDPVNGQMQMRLDPDGNLLFGTRTRQMLNLWDTVYGIGIQANTLYFRTDFDFCWFRGGSHRNPRSDPGGGSLMMKLDENNVLTLNGDVRVAKRLFVDGAQVPVDVRSGFHVLNRIGAGTGTEPLEIPSRLTNANGAEIMVALADIRNRGTAVDARWRVAPGAAPQKLSANLWRFFVDWAVEDIDGDLIAFSWIVIFTP
jgi:hypothetical protein